MKTTCCKIIKLMFFNVSVFAVIIGSSQSATAKVNRVAIVPFQINAEKDLSFLRDGIVDMLTSRLYLEDKVAVLSREETAKVLETVSPRLMKARRAKSEAGLVWITFFSAASRFSETVLASMPKWLMYQAAVRPLPFSIKAREWTR